MNWISMNLISNTLNIYESNLLSWPVHLTMEKLNDPNHEVYYCDQMMPQCFNKEYQQLKMYQNRQICTCHSSGWSVGHTNRPGSKPNFYLKSCVIDSLQVLVTCHIKQQQCSVILTSPKCRCCCQIWISFHSPHCSVHFVNGFSASFKSMAGKLSGGEVVKGGTCLLFTIQLSQRILTWKQIWWIYLGGTCNRNFTSMYY